MEKQKTFICIISNIFTTDSETSLINSIREFSGEIKKILDNNEWNPPEEYRKEMGLNLKNKILFLEESKTIDEIEKLKDFCILKEKETSIGDSRTFNLNPGYFNDKGMFLLSHKPNEKRRRNKLSKYWIEKQYDMKDGIYIENTNTFSEYKNERIVEFNAFVKHP